MRGDIALTARQWSQAEADCHEALRIARQISYPTLTWQAAHLLAQSQAGQNNLESAFATVQLAVETIDAVAARIPDPALRQTFLAWPRVQAVGGSKTSQPYLVRAWCENDCARSYTWVNFRNWGARCVSR